MESSFSHSHEELSPDKRVLISIQPESAMKTTAQLLLVLLWSLVEVHSQTAPYVSFMGETLPNHGYVDLTLVGDDDSDPGNVVRCHTDLETCCRPSEGSHRGNWYFPNGDTVETSGDIYRTRGDQLVILRRRNNANSPSGIYHCEVPTLAVHSLSSASEGETVYVGVYASGGEGPVYCITKTFMNHSLTSFCKKSASALPNVVSQHAKILAVHST